MDYNPFRSGRATQQTVQEDVDKSKYPLNNPMKTYKVKHPKFNGKINAKSHEDAFNKLRAKGLKGILSVTQEDTQTEAIDPVNKSELKGKHSDRKDKDINNDGKADNTDKYLHKRRKAISKAMDEDKTEEGYYKDLEIKKQDKEMGAKPVPAKKKKEAKNGGKEGDVEMNPKMDIGGKSEQKESRIRSALKSVLESNRDDHYKSATKPETMKDMRKGKGAEDMMADADKEIDKGPDAHLNEPAIDKENFKKMTSNVPSKKMRKNDNPKGDTKIVPGGTQFKDPAAMKPEESTTKADDKQSGGFVHKESVSFAQSINNMRNAYASMYATKEENSEDLNEVYESSDHQLDEKAPSADIVDKLKDGIGRRNHNGHEGAEIEHNHYADDHKGTAAGKLHAKAAMHHSNALQALNKGNMTTSLKHAKLAKDAAAKAHKAGGEKSGSADVHADHDLYARRHASTGTSTYDAYKKAKKKADRANPMKARIGKAKSKIKSLFKTRKESVQEAKEGDHGYGTADNYTHHVKGYTGERGDPEHHAMLAKAKARNVKVTAGRSKEYMYGGKHIILRGKKKDVDHVIDNHIGRDE